MVSQLKAIRRSRGLAIWGLAVLSGVSPSLLTAIEKWGYRPSADTQRRIADALKLEIEDIWMQEDTLTSPIAEEAPTCGGTPLDLTGQRERPK